MNTSMFENCHGFNTSNTTTCNSEDYKYWQWDCAGAVYIALIAVAAMVGNGALCWIILSNPSLRTIPNRLVLNLACCDLLTAALNAPFKLMVLVHRGWRIGAIMCNANGFLTTFLGVASVLTLAVISVNRFYMIVHTSRCSHVFTSRKTNAMIAGVWLFSALCGLPPLLGWSQYTFSPGKAICTLSWSTNISYTLTVLTLAVLLPFVVMLVSYYRIANTVRNSRRRIQVSTNRRSADTEIRRQLFRTVATLVATALSGKERDNLRMTNDTRLTTVNDGSPSLHRRLLPAKRSTKSSGKRPFPGLSVPVSVMVEDVSSCCSSMDDLDVITGENNPGTSVMGASTCSLTLPGEASRPAPVTLPTQPLPRWLGASNATCLPPTGTKPRQRRRSSLEAPMSPVWHVVDIENTEETAAPPLPYPPKMRRLSLDLTPDGATVGNVCKLAHAQLLSAATLSAPTSRCHSQESLDSCCNTGQQGHGQTAADISSVNSSSLTNLLSDSEAKHVIDGRKGKNAHAPQPRRSSDELKVTGTIFLVILVFVISWAPISIVNCVETFSEYQIPLQLDRFTICMVFLQSALNPIIYGVRNRNFRDGFRRLFCCGCCSQDKI